jgi:hypothetical protein
MRKALLTLLILAVVSPCLAKYSGGAGTAGDPYKIATKADLIALAANTADYCRCFILTADINMRGQVFTKAIIGSGGPFTGAFDGNNHKITNFTISGGTNDLIGLFNYTTSLASIKNLGIENFVSDGNSCVGGLAGVNCGSISNCYSTGSVSGHWEVGGLAGQNQGDINNCHSTGSVSGHSTVGGLVGENVFSSSISNCYSTCSVSGHGEVGGLVGYSYQGSISNCYSTGTVSGDSGSNYVGGLMGSNSGSISKCYSTGIVSGDSNVGGFVGYNVVYMSISGCFWDKQTSGQTTGIGGGSLFGVSGKTTEQMTTLSTFTSASWNFTTIWRMKCERMNYPKLNWQAIPAADLVCPDGVNFVDLAYFAERWQTIGCDSSNNFCGGTDLTGDGIVDMLDIAVFADDWLVGL